MEKLSFVGRQESSLSHTERPGYSLEDWQEAPSHCVQANRPGLCWLPDIVRILALCPSIPQKAISQNCLVLQGCSSILKSVTKCDQHHSPWSPFHQEQTHIRSNIKVYDFSKLRSCASSEAPEQKDSIICKPVAHPTASLFLFQTSCLHVAYYNNRTKIKLAFIDCWNVF